MNKSFQKQKLAKKKLELGNIESDLKATFGETERSEEYNLSSNQNQANFMTLGQIPGFVSEQQQQQDQIREDMSSIRRTKLYQELK